jgi:transketolase
VRAAFVRTLNDLAKRDRRILLLTGDLGFMALEPFAESFPDRFWNAGVAEQNMVGLSTGLAESGFLCFVYSIVTFASLRPFEFIRNGPIFHNLPVRIVGVGGGFEYGSAGPTHFGLDDIGVMRTQPQLTIVAPADHEQTVTALEATWDLPGPVYLRLGKNDKKTVPGLGGRFELGRAQWIRQGSDLAILAMGSIASEATAAADSLDALGIDATVLIIASVSPVPIEDVVTALATVPIAITVEAHSVVGGLGSLVSEVVAERGLRCRVVRCGVRGRFNQAVGGEGYLHRVHGLEREQLVETARRALCLARA